PRAQGSRGRSKIGNQCRPDVGKLRQQANSILECGNNIALCCALATPQCSRKLFQPPAAAFAEAKAEMAFMMLEAALSRHSGLMSCASSSGLDRYPSSTSTEGTSGARRTLKPAKRCGLLISPTVVESSPTSVFAKLIEK